MKSLTVTVPHHDVQYPILIGENVCAEAFSPESPFPDINSYSQVVVITDSTIKDHHLRSFTKHLGVSASEIILSPGEETKNIETVQTIWKKLTDLTCDRKTLIINLGGGVIGDMGGFAAATYMRGVDFIQVPTTLLSMVDASVGGKVGINFAGIKNLIGSFQQPRGVIIDTAFLRTLPSRAFTASFAEIIKHGVIADERYFSFVTSKQPSEFTPEELTEIIYQSCGIKARIVESDEHESGQRKILNFGHTIGHAIESLSLETGKPLLHGEAVTIGMIAEAKISERGGYLESDHVTTIENAIQNVGLPTRVVGFSPAQIHKKMEHDKKNSFGTIKWTILTSLGEADFNIVMADSYVQEALSYIIEGDHISVLIR